MERDPHFHELLMRRGRVNEIARAAGVSKQAVSQWRWVPAEKVQQIAEALGLTPHDLRPDLWPLPTESITKEQHNGSPTR